MESLHQNYSKSQKQKLLDKIRFINIVNEMGFLSDY